MVKIVYIILAHQNASQVVRLYQRLRHPDASFVFHLDKKAPPAFVNQIRAALEKQAGCHFCRREVAHWGTFSLVQASLSGIETIFQKQLPHDYAILLSGQDYPIKTNAYIQRYLAGLDGNSVIESIPYADLPDDDKRRFDHVHWRWNKFHFQWPYLEGDGVRSLINQWVMKMAFPSQRVVPTNQIFKGSAWWALSAGAISYLHTSLDSACARRFIQAHKRVSIPEESFYQTWLQRSPLADQLINDEVHYIKWDEGSHPLPLSSKDLPAMRQSTKLFARKFDQRVDGQLLAQIDQMLDDEDAAST